MSEILLALLSQLNSSVFVLLGILVLAFWLAYKTGSWKQTFEHHQNRIDKVELMSDRLIKVETKVDLIYQHVAPQYPTRSASPINLTDSGKQIVKNIGAEAVFNKYAKKLISAVVALKPRNAYDIQKISFELAQTKLMELLSEEELGAVKQEAYNRGLLAEDVMTVYGILLRNKVLEQQGIPISEVDRHAT